MGWDVAAPKQGMLVQGVSIPCLVLVSLGAAAAAAIIGAHFHPCLEVPISGKLQMIGTS